MYEIKFRAWDLDRKMFIGFGVGKFSNAKGNNYTNPGFSSDFDGILKLEDRWYNGDYYSVVWEQYSNYHDSDDNEIFQGDILGSKSGTDILDKFLFPAIVTIEDGCFIAKSLYPSNSGEFFSEPLHSLATKHKNNILVLGNKWENPILLPIFNQ